MGIGFSKGFDLPPPTDLVNDVIDLKLRADQIQNVIRSDISSDLSAASIAVSDLENIVRDDLNRALNIGTVTLNSFDRMISNDLIGSVSALMEIAAPLIAQEGDVGMIEDTFGTEAVVGEAPGLPDSCQGLLDLINSICPGTPPEVLNEVCCGRPVGTCFADSPFALGVAIEFCKRGCLKELFPDMSCEGTPGGEPIPDPLPDPRLRWTCVDGNCFPSIAGEFATEDECLAACGEQQPEEPPEENGDGDECCPPSVVNVNVPPCPPPLPPPEDEEKEVLYSVWENTETGLCAIVIDLESPPPGKWRLNSSGLTISQASATAAIACPDEGPGRPEPRTGLFIASGKFLGTDLCASLEERSRTLNSNIEFPIAYAFDTITADGTPKTIDSLRDFKILGIDLGKLITSIIGGTAVSLDFVTKGLLAGIDLALPTDIQKVGGLITGGIINALTNNSLQFITQPQRYALNFGNPYILPTTNAAGTAFLQNGITEREFRCITRANGELDDEAIKVLFANRTKLTTGELTTLWRRKELNNEQFNTRVRELGYLDANITNELRELSQQVPFVTDITRMMVRDADDERLVKRFGLDDEFENKFREQLKEWADDQGVTEQHMRFLWRSHWSIPSPGQLFEMWHRLRNKGDTFANSEIGGDINEALIQQDILPFWIPRFEQISFRPLTRRDSRRAFEIGALSEDQLEKTFRDQGNSDENAEILVNFSKRLKVDRVSRSQPARDFRDGAINRGQAKQRMVDRFGSPDIVELAIDRAEEQAISRSRILCTRALRKRFLTGEFTPTAASNELIRQGLDQQQAGIILAGWICELDARGKEIPGGQLCTMFDQGLIDSDEFVRRLRRVGFRAADAQLIVQSCGVKVVKKQVKEQAAIDKKTEQLSRRAESARRARQRKDLAVRKKLTDAALVLHKLLAISVDDAADLIGDGIDLLTSDFVLTNEEKSEILLKGARAFKGKDQFVWLDHVRDVAEVWIAEAAVLASMNRSNGNGTSTITAS